MRSKQLEFLSPAGNRSIKCTLKNIGLIYSNGAFSFKEDEKPDDEITTMLNRLIKVKPDLFSKITYGTDVVKLSLNSICSRLNKLTQNPVNDLTEENLTILTKELKTRIHNFFKDRGFKGDLVKTCEFREIHIKNIAGVVVEGSSLLENEFTKLLTILMKKKPEFFTKRGTDVNLPKTSLSALYKKICDFTRKPITKDQIPFLINGLESRKNNLLEHRKNTGNPSKACLLSDFFFIRNSIILEKDTVLVDYEFTGLLENLRKQKPKLFPKNDEIDLFLIYLNNIYYSLV